MQKLLKASKILIISLFFIFSFILSTISIIDTSYMWFDVGKPIYYEVKYGFGLTGFTVAVTLLLVIILIWLVKNNFFNINKKYILIIELCVFCILSVIYLVYNFKFDVDCDSKEVFYSAESLYYGDYSVLDYTSYINEYPNNAGLLTFELFLFNIFKSALAVKKVFRVLNLCSIILSYFFIYKITDILFDDYVVDMCLLFVMIGFSQYIFYVTFIYGNVLSYAFSIASIYFLISYLKNTKILYFLISLACITFSVYIKENSLIVLIAELIVLLCKSIEIKKYIKLILCCAILVICTFSVSYYPQKWCSSIAGYDYSETKLPTIAWIAYGLNYDPRTPGRFFSEIIDIHKNEKFDNSAVIDDSKVYINRVINEFSKNPLLAIDFYFNKIRSSWCNPRYDAFTLLYNDIDPMFKKDSFQNIFSYVWDGYLNIFSLGMLLFIFNKNKKNDFVTLLPALVFVGGFIFHLFWEIKSVYVYFYILLLLPYSAFGLSKITQFLKQ